MTLIDINPDLAFFVLRLAAGILFLAHGPQKLGQEKAKKIAKGVGMKPGTIMLVGALETLGAISLILGAWMQIGALFLAAVMLGTIYLKTQKWNTKFTDPQGWELDFILLAVAIAVLLGAPTTYALFG